MGRKRLVESKIDLIQLEKEITDPKYKFGRKNPLWQLLKRLLMPMGYWKNRSRGNPKLGYAISQKRKTKNS